MIRAELAESARSMRLAGGRKQVKVRIESRAPTRIDLAGGTLDIWPLYLFHEGSLTVNCAITRYASCVIETAPEPSRRIVLVSRDTKRKESFASFEALCRARRYKLPLLAHLVRVFRPTGGFTLTTDSEAPAGAGIGGSSAMAVAICAALDRLTGPGCAAKTGSTSAATSKPSSSACPPGRRIITLRRLAAQPRLCSPRAASGAKPWAAISTNSSAGWSFATRENPGNTASTTGKCSSGTSMATGAFRKIWKKSRSSRERVRAALERSEWNEVGRLVREEWDFRRRNLRTISTPLIDRVISSARRQGALAGKVCGAGGGGCVTLVIDPDARARVEAAVAAAGAKLLPLRIDRGGVLLQSDADRSSKSLTHPQDAFGVKISREGTEWSGWPP